MTLRALVVDDTMVFRLLGRTALETGGFEVDEAESGEQALLACADTRYDLVVSDVIMGGIDGWELVRRLRQQPAHAAVPVIFMTSLDDVEKRPVDFRDGSDAVLSKPFDVEQLAQLARESVAGDESGSRHQPDTVEGR